jgi:hypothetical protein
MGVGGKCQALTVLPTEKRLCTGCRVGPWASLDGSGKSRPYRDSIPRPASPLQIAVRTALSRPIPIAHIRRSWGLKRNLITYKHSKSEIL